MGSQFTQIIQTLKYMTNYTNHLTAKYEDQNLRGQGEIHLFVLQILKNNQFQYQL